MSHKTEVVVVTGASAGVGRAVVREYARKGAAIGLIARGHVGLDAVSREVEQLGGKAIAVPADVSCFSNVDAAATTIEDTFGPIDVWINNAMVSILCPLDEIAPDEFKRVTEVTYLGYVYGTMAALKRMKPRDRGVIVQVGSALAHRSIPLQSAYCGAKHAIVGFTESLRCELIHDKSKIRTTMVHLPGVNTPQFQWIKNCLPNKPQPVGTIFQPEVAARAILWAAEHHPREMLVGMPTVKSVIGDKFVPGTLDRYLARLVYREHQTDEPDDPARLNNLWNPVEIDYGAHGPFDSSAKQVSAQLWLNTHLTYIGMFAAFLVGLALTSSYPVQRKRLADYSPHTKS